MQFKHNLFVQFFIEHLIIASLSQFRQETIDLLGGHEEHFIEHFLQMIFLHILHNKEQLMHINFSHKLFSQVFEQDKHILILHIEHIFKQSLFEHRLHLFVIFSLLLLLLLFAFLS